MQIPYRKPGQFSQIKFDPLMTKAKFTQLKNKLDWLKKNRPAAAEEVTRLGELGDFSENAGYQFAKGRLRGINNTILNLETQLNQAVIINPEAQTDTVQIGHRVTIKNGHVKKIYQILGSSETSPQTGIISRFSPLGAALIGRKVGETITVKLARQEVSYQIVAIQ